MILFSVIMCGDIAAFGYRMRALEGSGALFDWPGRLVLGFLGVLLVGGWALAGSIVGG